MGAALGNLIRARNAESAVIARMLRHVTRMTACAWVMHAALAEGNFRLRALRKMPLF